MVGRVADDNFMERPAVPFSFSCFFTGISSISGSKQLRSFLLQCIIDGSVHRKMVCSAQTITEKFREGRNAWKQVPEIAQHKLRVEIYTSTLSRFHLPSSPLSMTFLEKIIGYFVPWLPQKATTDHLLRLEIEMSGASATTFM
jgi:hypothetical protein